MPVEERLRIGFADNVAEVLPDVEQRLGAVRRRRVRRRAALAGSLVAACVAGAVGAALLVPGEPPAPGPTSPYGERVSSAGETVPLGRYVREVTRDEARAAGFPRDEIRWLFGADESARVVMGFREDPDGAGAENGWTLTFVDETGKRHGRDGGAFFYGGEGQLSIFSLWKDCFGCTAHYAWHVADDGRLTLEPLPTTRTTTPVVRLLAGGSWVRQDGPTGPAARD